MREEPRLSFLHQEWQLFFLEVRRLGRYSRVIRNICRMLEVEYCDPLMIECPMCETESLKLRGDNPLARCEECGLAWKMGELEIVMEQEFDYEKRKIANLMRERKGVQL